MAKTPPFFRHVAHATGLMAPSPVTERYPYHDNDACLLGQEIKASGQWQYYAPVQDEEIRECCLACLNLNRRQAPAGE